MQNSFPAHTAQASMAMHNLNLFANDDVAEDGKEREDCWECGSSIYDQERYMVDLEAIRKVAYTCSTFVVMCDDYDFVAAINQLCRQLVDMTFDSSRLGKEEVAYHSDVVRHIGGECL